MARGYFAIDDPGGWRGLDLVSTLVALDARGLVDRTPHADDARRTDVRITSTGRDLVATVAPGSDVWYSTIEAHLGAADLDQLHRLLDRLAELDAAADDLRSDRPRGEGT